MLYQLSEARYHSISAINISRYSTQGRSFLSKQMSKMQQIKWNDRCRNLELNTCLLNIVRQRLLSHLAYSLRTRCILSFRSVSFFGHLWIQQSHHISNKSPRLPECKTNSKKAITLNGPGYITVYILILVQNVIK